MSSLVSLERFKAHLKLRIGPAESPPSAFDEDLQGKLDAAESSVLRYLRRPSDVEWTAEIASWLEGSPLVAPPPEVIQTILIEGAVLYAFTGEEVDQPKRNFPGGLTATSEALLYRYRQPIAR